MQNDKHIWDGLKRGKEDSLSYVYHQHVDFLFFYGKKITGNENLIYDTIQDLFYHLIRNRQSLGDVQNIRLYLLKSFRRRLLLALEKERKLTGLEATHEFDVTFSVEEDWIKTEEMSRQKRFLREAMTELNEKQREILYYRFTCGFDYLQICEIMSISYTSARQLTSRAVNTLKKYLADRNFILMLLFQKKKKK